MPENGGIGVFAHEYAHNLGADGPVRLRPGRNLGRLLGAAGRRLDRLSHRLRAAGARSHAPGPVGLARSDGRSPTPARSTPFTLGQASDFPGGDGVYRGAKIELPDGAAPLAVPVWQGDHYWWGGKADLANGMMTTVDADRRPRRRPTLVLRPGLRHRRGVGLPVGPGLDATAPPGHTLTNANTVVRPRSGLDRRPVRLPR